MAFVELPTLSSFTFVVGASHPEEFIMRELFAATCERSRTRGEHGSCLDEARASYKMSRRCRPRATRVGLQLIQGMTCGLGDILFSNTDDQQARTHRRGIAQRLVQRQARGLGVQRSDDLRTVPVAHDGGRMFLCCSRYDTMPSKSRVRIRRTTSG